MNRLQIPGDQIIPRIEKLRENDRHKHRPNQAGGKKREPQHIPANHPLVVQLHRQKQRQRNLHQQKCDHVNGGVGQRAPEDHIMQQIKIIPQPDEPDMARADGGTETERQGCAAADTGKRLKTGSKTAREKGRAKAGVAVARTSPK